MMEVKREVRSSGMESENLSDLTRFSQLTEMLECVFKANRKTKTSILELYFVDLKKKALLLKNQNPSANTSTYSCMRLILPDLDRERGPYGIREHTLARKLIKLLALPNNSQDAQCLLTRTTTISTTTADFPDVAYQVLKKYFTTTGTLSLTDINNFLDKLARKHAHSPDIQDNLEDGLFNIFQKMSALELKWLFRLILKNMRLGIGSNAILKAYHPDAPDYFSLNSNLLKVCDDLIDPKVHLDPTQITVFSAFRPMLSVRCGKGDLKRIFEQRQFVFIETKFDGERFQLHMSNGKLKYFSRRGYDMTNSFGEDFNEGLLTPRLKNSFNDTTSIILDGEMMGYNKLKREFGSKGMTFDVKHLKADSVHQPCFIAFDILMHNGTILINTPLHERMEILKRALNRVEGSLEISTVKQATNEQEIVDALNANIDTELEGIVIKDPYSLYKPNSRKEGWWKLKADYFNGVVSDLDVLILGGCYGDNTRSVTSFLVGIKDANRFLAFGKVYSGFSDRHIQHLHETLSPHYIRVHSDDQHLSHGVLWGKDAPDCYIPPKNSIVITVRASELIKDSSDSYRTAYTFRFPRVVGLREDKPYDECMTTEELAKLTEGNRPVEKLFLRYVTVADLSPTNKKRQLRSRIERDLPLKYEKVSDLLQGYEFCVVSGAPHCSKAEVEQIVVMYGGVLTKEPTRNTLCALVGNTHPRTKAWQAARADLDLVTLEWLIFTTKRKVFKLYGPLDIIHARPRTVKRLQSEYDRFGDSFEKGDLESLKLLCSHIITKYDLSKLEVDKDFKENLTEKMPGNYTRYCYDGYKAYFDPYVYQSDSCIEKMMFKLMSGKVLNKLSKDVDFVITDLGNQERVEQLTDLLKSLNNNAELLSDNSIEQKWKKFQEYLSDSIVD